MTTSMIPSPRRIIFHCPHSSTILDEAGLYSFFTQSVPTPTLELGELPSDRTMINLERKARETASAKEAREAFDQRDANFSRTLFERNFALGCLWLSTNG